MLSDLRHSLRTIARAKSTSAVLLLSLGLGTGANAAVYGVLDALLLRGPAGLDRPSELVSLFTTDNTGAGVGPSSYPDFLSVQASAPAFAAMAAIDDTTVENIRIGDSEHAVRVARVSERFFPVLGLPASAGQLRLDGGEHPSAVISFTIAEQHGSSALIGRTLAIGDRTFLIAGVAPRHFRGLQVGRECDLWLLLPHGGASRRPVLPGPVDDELDHAFACRRAIEQVGRQIVNVDLHPPRPGRAMIPGGLPDPDIDEAPLLPLAPHLVAEEFGARRHPHWKIERQRFPGLRPPGIERVAVLRLQAVPHAIDRIVDHAEGFHVARKRHVAKAGALLGGRNRLVEVSRAFEMHH